MHKPIMFIENKIILFNPNSPHGDSLKHMPNRVEFLKTPLDVVHEETFIDTKHFPRTFFTWPSANPIDDVNGPMPSLLRLGRFPKAVNFYFFHSSTTKWALIIKELIDFSSPSINCHYMVPK